MSAGKIVLLVFGILILLGAVAVLFGGGAVMWVHYGLADDDGFISTDTIDIDRDSYAVVTPPADIELGAGMWDGGGLATIRVEGQSDDPDNDIFIGIAAEPDLDEYLDDVEYDEVSDFSLYPLELSYSRRHGDAEPAPPSSETFWVQEAYGAGTQTLEWELEEGSYSLVLMNANGSAGLELSVIVAASIPVLFWIGLGLLIAGVVGLVLGIVMIVLAARRPREAQPPPEMIVVED